MGHWYRSTRTAGAIGAVCLAAALGVALAMEAAPRSAAADAPAATTTTTAANSITVSAGADERVAPDRATVNFGVLVNRDTAADAQEAANIVIAAAVKNLHALGIPDRHIQTADMSLQPRFDSSGTAIIGYQASQTLSVEVDRLAQVGRVVDAGVSAQANNNVSITFGLSDENAARTAALTLAVQRARGRAQAIAATLGRSLVGAHVQVSETSPSTPQPVVAQYAVKAPATADSTPTQAFGGTLTVHEDVTLTYTFS